VLQIQTAPSSSSTATLDPSLLSATAPERPNIRDYLTQWQNEHGGPDEETLSAFGNHPVFGETQNILSKLNSSSKADEAEDSTMDAREEGEEEGESLLTIGLFLTPGDVVELSQPGHEPVLAVFVQQLEDSSQFFSVNGRWCHSKLARVTFAVPRCINPALLEPLVPYMPTKPSDAAGAKGEVVQVPRRVGAPVQAQLQQLTDEAEKIYRTNAPVLDTAYAVLADTARTRMMTLAQIAKLLLGKKSDPTWSPSPSALLAVRKALNHNEFRFLSDPRSQRMTNVFGIRPKHDVEVIETVQGWVREYNEDAASLVSDFVSRPRRSNGGRYVSEFVEKARRLITISRKDRDPNAGGVGPSRVRHPLKDQQSSLRPRNTEEKFTDADKQIIQFLQAWVLTQQFSRWSSLNSTCTTILYATGMYGDDSGSTNAHSLIPDAQKRGNIMGQGTGYLFLQEIGVIAPHENRSIYDEQLMLPTVRLSRNLELLNTKAELTRRNPEFRDSMADLRRDWGAATIFCIDDAGAKEIDDGVSIERIEGKDSEFWLHVHVANPTAFFDKTHVLSGLAAHMTESVYAPEKTYPMLPKWASQDYFSLDANRPVITFSSRIDDSGNLVESKIQHGIIRNVISITPSEVSKCLGEQAKVETSTLVVGGDVPVTRSTRSTPSLTSAQLQDLQDMYTVAKARWTVRSANGAVSLESQFHSVNVYENTRQPGLSWIPPSLDQARFVQGDPIIQILASKSNDTLFRAGTTPADIVEECMLLACASAASWCTERNLPVVYRGTIEMPSEGMSLEQFKEQVVAPHIEKYGRLSPGLGQRLMQAGGRALAHSSPVPHKSLGVPGYVKVTSPLRRFSDMITHWQIEGAIRHESRTGVKLNSAVIASAPRPILPFSLRQIQESILTLSPREKIISAQKSNSRHHWAVQAFNRAFNYNEAPLPETFKVWIRRGTGLKGGRVTTGYTTDLSVKVGIKDDDVICNGGDQWLVKMHSVDLYHRTIWVTPIELLYRDALDQDADTI
jgi:hypothetical protein